MNYNENFKNLVEQCSKNGTYIGTGNPNSKILIVGKETATDVENKAGKDEHYLRFQNEALIDFKENANKWNLNISNKIEVNSIPNWKAGIDTPISSNPIYPYKSLHAKELKEGHTWRKYQKLHDLVLLNDMSNVTQKEFDFHQNFFVTEMNSSPAKFTRDANKTGISGRKQLFKEILACSNYINGSEIEDIFDVKFENQFGTEKQLFWTHYNSERTKLVIHTRQLSTNVSDTLLKGIAEKISELVN